MPQYLILYEDGPCKRDVPYMLDAPRPPAQLTCRNTVYVRDLYTPAGASLQYVVRGGPNDVTAPDKVRGQRDVYAQWRRLMRVIGRNSTGELVRLTKARHRIRRAVR